MTTYNTQNYLEQGGAHWYIGGDITIAGAQKIGNGLTLKTYEATLSIPAGTNPAAAGGVVLTGFSSTATVAILFAQIKIGAANITVGDSGAGDPAKLGIGVAADPDAYAKTTNLTANNAGNAFTPLTPVTANTVKVFGALANNNICTSGTIGGTGQSVTVQITYYEVTGL